jgi:hypothetical protein
MPLAREFKETVQSPIAAVPFPPPRRACGGQAARRVGQRARRPAPAHHARSARLAGSLPRSGHNALSSHARGLRLVLLAYIEYYVTISNAALARQ